MLRSVVGKLFHKGPKNKSFGKLSDKTEGIILVLI